MLEQEGIVARRSYPESPPRVEYELTDKGVALLPIIDAMSSFGHEWLIDDHDHEHVTPAAASAASRPPVDSPRVSAHSVS